MLGAPYAAKNVPLNGTVAVGLAVRAPVPEPVGAEDRVTVSALELMEAIVVPLGIPRVLGPVTPRPAIRPVREDTLETVVLPAVTVPLKNCEKETFRVAGFSVTVAGVVVLGL
jgi:hypothetical protein